MNIRLMYIIAFSCLLISQASAQHIICTNNCPPPPTFASALKFTSNVSTTDEGKNITFYVSETLGKAPYYFTIYVTPANASIAYLVANASGQVVSKSINTSKVSQITGIKYGQTTYVVTASDSYDNRTNSSYITSLIITTNSTPKLSLHPQNATILPDTNITFTNTIIGGSPPYSNYTYNVTGNGQYNRTNNTVTFNGIGSYEVKLKAQDKFKENATGISFITVGYTPVVVSSNDCIIISNFSQTEIQPIIINGNTVDVVENYITPTYAGITVGGHSINFNGINEYLPVGGYYAGLLNVSWIPILQTVKVSICPSNPLQTTSLSTSSSTTSSTSTTSESTTSLKSSTSSTSSTTILPSTLQESTTTIKVASQSGSPTNYITVAIFIVAIAIVGGYLLLKGIL